MDLRLSALPPTCGRLPYGSMRPRFRDPIDERESAPPALHRIAGLRALGLGGVPLSAVWMSLGPLRGRVVSKPALGRTLAAGDDTGYRSCATVAGSSSTSPPDWLASTGRLSF